MQRYPKLPCLRVDRSIGPLCLPCEWEWQCAGCGGQVGALYPWGDEKEGGVLCNDQESGFKKPIAVGIGMYSQGNAFCEEALCHYFGKNNALAERHWSVSFRKTTSVAPGQMSLVKTGPFSHIEFSILVPALSAPKNRAGKRSGAALAFNPWRCERKREATLLFLCRSVFFKKRRTKTDPASASEKKEERTYGYPSSRRYPTPCLLG